MALEQNLSGDIHTQKRHDDQLAKAAADTELLKDREDERAKVAATDTAYYRQKGTERTVGYQSTRNF